jgi:hypothetical protein
MIPEGTEELAQGDDPFQIRYSFRTSTEYPRTLHSEKFSASWNDIFAALAPIMINEASEVWVFGTLQGFVKRSTNLSENLFEFSLDQADFDTIKVQLSSSRTHQSQR